MSRATVGDRRRNSLITLMTLPRTLFSVVILSQAMTSGPAMAECSEAATTGYDRGIVALEAGNPTVAIQELETATTDCSSPNHWIALGNALRESNKGLPEQSDTLAERALGAYGTAFGNARSSQNDTAGAEAARAIAEVGLDTGDPLKAQNWLLVASRLDPENPELPALQQRLDEARTQLSADEIDTGLSQTRGIGTVNSLLGGKVSSNAFWDPEDEDDGGAGGGTTSVSASIVAPPVETLDAVSIAIPIRFLTNSTELTAETAINVRNLAEVLGKQSSSSQVSLTGHADVRGDAKYNQELSLARADAIRDLLQEAEASLVGRIDTFGAGESEPLDFGDSQRAHANNRRLEVTVTEPGATAE
ncbi:MAG: OmpA family protein [Pseudomonadota bacterium]